MPNGALTAYDVANSVTSLALIDTLVAKGLLTNDDVRALAHQAASKVAGEEGEAAIVAALRMYFPGAGL